MADIFDSEPADNHQPSSALLLCDETRDLCFDDHLDHVAHTPSPPIYDHQNLWFNAPPRSEPSIHFPPLSEDGFASLVNRETNYLPNKDYLRRLRCGELNFSARNDAFDWIWKAHSYYSFEPLSLCLAVNYLDRFLSNCDLPREKDWAVQLLAVACLSIAAKVEETCVPQPVELQVGDPKYMFQSKTIQRMELLVLDTLDWKMNAITPCSFLDYSLKKMCDFLHNNNSQSLSTSTKVVNRSMQLILCTFRGIDLLEFKASEIAAAVAIFVAAEFQAVDFDNAISVFSLLDKDRVSKCIEMIERMTNAKKRRRSTKEDQDGGVLDNVACLSYKDEDLTQKVRVGSYPNAHSSHISTSTVTSKGSPEIKRQRL